MITCHFKNLISPKSTWNCQRSQISSRKLKRCITAHSSAHISDFFKKFLKKSFKTGHGNLVQITSTAQVELSKLNFNFDDIRIYFLQVLRDCRQITFVTLNGFCQLTKTPTPLFLMDNIKMDRILTKIFYIVFQVLKVLLIKICKIQSLDLLFLVVFISFYISRYHFSQVFRTSFNIIWKKDFRHKFSFFNRFTQTPTTPPP